MAALIPATSNVEAAYEDMFKEITRKLYGEETGNGLHTLGTPVAQVATTGPTAPEGERSFTNLIDRSSAPTIEYEHNAGAAAANSGGAATGNVATVTAAAVAAAAAMQQQQSEGSTNIVVGESAAGEHHLSTAFGLAALMQNGFTQNNLQQQQQQQMSMNVNKSASQANNEQRWATTATNVTGGAGGANEDVSIATAVNSAGGNQQAVQILHWTSAGKLQNYTNNQQQQQQQQQPPQQQLKHKTSPTTTVTNINMNVNSEQNSLLQNSNASSTAAHKNGTGGPRKKATQHINQQQQQNTTPKRYACSHCPYSTDRRDLYTRHENIHKDEKPFQCYACLKQFNRADHVKKHFLRMHRELQYDINKTRRQVSSNTGTGHQQRSSMSSSSASGSPEQKPNIFHAANVQLENAFLQTQRQPTASSLSIAETIEAVATAADTPLVQLKQEKCDDISVNLLTAAGLDTTQPEQTCVKPKREKRFSCCYCSWSGADKWGLKRHLNTHTKPFVCLLCDYKAARSERLATHILKVHNKRACNKCAFLADSQEEYQTHLNEVHLLKMDAISRNTASVAQDFHKAGGVQELKIPANHQLLFNNRLLTQQWTAKEAAALLASLSNNKNAQESQIYLNQLIQQQQQQQQIQQQQQQQKQQEKQQNIRKRNHSTGEEDENTPSSASSTTSNDGEMSSAVSTTSSSMGSNASIDQRKAMLKFLSNNFNLKENKLKNEINYNNNNNINNKHNINQVYMNENQENQEQLIESPPASSLKYKNNNNNNLQKHKIFHDNNNNSNNKKFRLDLYKDNKENTVVSATIDPNNMTNAAAQVAANYLTALEYQNMNSHKIGTQLENYIKEIINKYYITNDIQTNMLCYAQQQQQQQEQQQRIDEEEIEEEQIKRKRVLSETEGYIEYLKNKSDITLTITPKLPAATTISTVPPTKRHHQQQSHHRQAVEIIPTTSSKQLKNNKNNNHNNNNQQHKNQMHNKKKSIGQIATLLPLLADAASKQQYLATPLDFSQKPLTTLTTLNDETTITTIPKSIPSSPTTTITKITNTATIATTTDNIVINNSNSKKRKQAQPKKKGRPSPQVILARLRDKYLNRLVKRKLKCLICAQKRHNSQMVFNYHSKATLTLHRLWKHPKKVIQKTFPHHQ